VTLILDEEDHEALGNMFAMLLGKNALILPQARICLSNVCFTKMTKFSDDKTLTSRVRFMYKDLIRPSVIVDGFRVGRKKKPKRLMEFVRTLSARNASRRNSVETMAVETAAEEQEEVAVVGAAEVVLRSAALFASTWTW
jgi:hypothetical protein